MINTKVGKYKITRLIGEGGMASVYEAEHEMLGTKVAIKVLNPILSANAQIRERFKNEAKMMASFNHPNITKIIDFDDQPHQLSIVMEYLEGEDLNEKIKRSGPLSQGAIQDIFVQTLSAFQYAHEKGVVHRDIKPSNIYVLPNGHVKILDFGIAKLFGQGNEMTQTGTQMGTPIYMSPEQVKADKSIDHRSDIYSLGVTLFFAINGKAPYNSDTDSQFDIFNKIVYEPLPEISSNSKYSGIIKKACAKNREERFQNCNAWLSEINNPSSAPITGDKTVIANKVNDDTTQVQQAVKNTTNTSTQATNEQPRVDNTRHKPQKVDSNISPQNIENSNNPIINNNKNNKRKVVLILTVLILFIFSIWGVFKFRNKSTDIKNDNISSTDSLQVETESKENVYRTVSFGNQVWMAENLRETNFRNGDKILQVNNFEEWMMAAQNKKPAWCFVNFDRNTELKYGKLYNGYAILDSRGLAPEGYKIPSVQDYESILTSVGIKKRMNEFPNGANKFKHLFPYAGGISYCLYCNYDEDKKEWVGPPKSYFFGENSIVRVWTKEDYNGDGLIWFGLNNDIDGILFTGDNLGQGFPVRCVSY
jgi:uncharacterized protein (TIGR02145 family)